MLHNRQILPAIFRIFFQRQFIVCLFFIKPPTSNYIVEAQLGLGQTLVTAYTKSLDLIAGNVQCAMRWKKVHFISGIFTSFARHAKAQEKKCCKWIKIDFP